MNMTRTRTWRRILKDHGSEFVNWLSVTQLRKKSFDVLAAKLEEFLKRRLINQADCKMFWEQIPNVRTGCNIPETYEKPFAADAYAYVHLLERYRRIWDVLLHLTQREVLPLGERGLDILDIGTGPAPALYAADDFYQLLSQFGKIKAIDELQIPPPRLNCIESSQSMIHFFHNFSEWCNRPGPGSAIIHNFSGVDFSEIRYWEFEKFSHKEYFNSESDTWDNDWTISEANDIANRLYRFRLIILSNFLTLSETIDRFKNEIVALFKDLRPGSVVLIIGAYGEHYNNIYFKLEQLALQSGIRRISWVDNLMGEISWADHADRMKAFHFAVFQHISSLCDPDTLPRKDHPDYWNPKPSPKFRRKFALRVFRKGKV